MKAHRQVTSAEDTRGSVSLRSRFHDVQQLSSKLMTSFITVSLERIDSEIREIIRKVVVLLDIDRGVLSQYSMAEKRMVRTHSYETSECGAGMGCRAVSIPDWVLRKILRGECVTVSTMEDVPADGEQAVAHFRREGTQSHISLPLVLDGEVNGCLSLECTRSAQHWPESAARDMKLMADILAMTIGRKRKQLEIIERMRFETMISDISARLVALEPDEIDEEINRAFEQLGRLFGAHRCGLLELEADNESVLVTHAWYDQGLERISGSSNLASLFPWSYERLFVRGEVVSVSNVADLPPAADRDRETFTAMGVRASLTVPLPRGKIIRHVIAFNNMKSERGWPEEYIPRLRLVGEVITNTVMRKHAELELKRSYEEIRALKEKLQVEAEFLRSEIRSCHSRDEIIGRSEALSIILKQAAQVAPTDTTVLICGETGTGKELVAQAIHDMSLYRDKLMVKVNCASLPSTLVESELFGREKGAYTGALTRQIGRFEMADNSTIFLDEIAELPLELQAKLLRVLQEHTFERLGSPKTIKVNVRVIAATNRNILEAVKKGTFREDLYYRLNVFPITVPPLRERVEDIPMLVWAFVTEFREKMGKRVNKIAKSDMEALQRYSWPGNIRELRNVIEHAVIVSSGDALELNLPQDSGKGITWARTLDEVECRHIMDVLRHTGGRIKGEGGAARILGMIPSTLTSRMKKLGIRLRNEKGEISS
jgi:transcriptional regulator with GAF, ATPase, and Fis domain